jgi:hypothetical protein
LQANRGALY